MKYEPLIGEHVSETAEAMVALAIKHGETVTAEFNDVPLTATPSSSPEEITQAYSKHCAESRAAYLASPEYAESQKMMRLEDLLAKAPGSLTVTDAAMWQSWVDANTDGYGAAIMNYTQLWGRIMEGAIASGETITQCAKRCSHDADVDGITGDGYGYGCAVKMLSQVWVHGEDLRRWHNKDTQIGTEGDEANESGGVLNPAVLSITTKEK
jgi:hypothetical protein